MNTDLDQIKELIKNHNPFAGGNTTKSHQIWENTLPDVPTINNHASDAVFSALELIKLGKIEDVVGITITGDKGIGKTQVISRIRRRLQQDKTGIFIYVGEHSSTNVKSVFLKRLSESMKKTGSMPGITQWQEIATHLMNEARKTNYLPSDYVKHFTKKPDVDFIEKHITILEKVTSEIDDPYLIKGILLTLVPKYSNYAVRWLAGQELTEKQLSVMGLDTDQELAEEQLSVMDLDLVSPVKEGDAFDQACKLLKIISKYKIPVICFDELDSTDIDPSGKRLSQIVASLGKDLSNNLKRCILLFAMYPHTWKDEIEGLSRAEAVVDRIAIYPQPRKPLDLKQLKGDQQVLELVSTWLNHFYQKHNINPPNPLYPFEADQLKNLARLKPNARDVLKWCSDNWNSLRDPQDQTENQAIENNIAKENNLVKIAFDRELEEVNSKIDSLMDDNQVISNALGFCFDHLVGETIEDFKIEKIESLPPKSKLKPCFKIIGLDHDIPITIGVVVAQHSNMQSLLSVLKQLVDYEKYQFTRGCLVRSKKASPGAKAVEKYLNIFSHEKGGEKVSFNADHITQIIALRELYEDRQDYDLTEEQIWQFASHKKIITENYLVKEILSAPPGNEPDNLIDEDADLEADNLIDENADLEADNLTYEDDEL